MSKEILAAILEEDASAIMEAFDQMMIEKISMLVEDRKQNIAHSLIMEQDGDEDDEDADSLEWDDDEHFDDPEEVSDEDGDEDASEPEQIDEVSKALAGSYLTKASAETKELDSARDTMHRMGATSNIDKLNKYADKRNRGIDRAKKIVGQE